MRPLYDIPPSEWPVVSGEKAIRIKVLASDEFLVQVFADPTGAYRLSINRCRLNNKGDWVDGITWDELQELKRLCGYGKHCAVEVYPPDHHIVNVSNMRHLWLIPVPPPFMWVNPDPEPTT